MMGDLAQYLIQSQDMVLAILSIWGLLPVFVEGQFVLIIYDLRFKNFVSSQYYSVQDPWVIAKQNVYVFNSNQFSIQFVIY
jgi:hypothetical protein